MRNLADCLQNRRWQWCSTPFPHIVAQNVFTESVYQDHAAGFKAILNRGLSDLPDPHRFSRTVSGYDAFTFNFHHDLSGSLGIFLSREWHDILASVLGISATLDVNGGFHHHAVGSASGWVHNDLNPGWFVDQSNKDRVNLSNYQLCNYHTGVRNSQETLVRETIRGAAFIYFLENPDWKPGDGGETGLYHSRRDAIDTPIIRVPPINNSMLLFECTPHSYHAFISNRRCVRNSVIMWIHRQKQDALSRWGEHSIVKW